MAGSRSWPGCTAIAALLQGDQLWVANAGDCRAVLCRGGLAMAASRDHNADDDEERRRVVAAGAQVAFRMGNWRVGQAGIQVTRQVVPSMPLQTACKVIHLACIDKLMA